jgi:FtsP/CotA-like multicopper oxidase with cupredoxin domain
MYTMTGMTRAIRRNTMRTKTTKLIALGVLLVVAVALMAGASVLAAPQAAPAIENLNLARAVPVSQTIAAGPKTFDLCATTGTVTLAGASVPIWGFVSGSTCTAGEATLPGPELRAVAGDSVTINLTNTLTTATSILIPGQVFSATTGTLGTFAAEAAANGGTASYEFIAQEGTYLYESGTNADIQVAMGLYGALIVEPAVSGLAYGLYAYNQDEVLVLGEIDPVLNANPSGFDMLDYHPVYWLINGQAYPDVPNMVATPESSLLLRYLNAGYHNLSMTLLGRHQSVIARNGYQAPSATSVVAEIIPAGATADMIVDTTGADGQSLALYNRNMRLTNAGVYPGGMLTFIDVQQPPSGSPPTVDIIVPSAGETVSGAAFSVRIEADDSDGTISGVEWSVGGGAWQMAAFDTGIQYTASWDTTTIGDGTYSFVARATDNDGNKSTASVTVHVDNVDDSPTVTIVSPDHLETLSGANVIIQVAASDDKTPVGTLTVTIAIDLDEQPAAWQGEFYEYVWTLPAAEDGVLHFISATAEDNSGTNPPVSASPIAVYVDNVNDPPVASFTYSCDGLACDFDGSGSSDADGIIVSYEWDFDNSGGLPDASGVTASHTFSGPGLFTVSLTVTDNGATGAPESGVTQQFIEVSDLVFMHLADFTGRVTHQNLDRPNERWTGIATVTVHDGSEAAVANATVSVRIDWTEQNKQRARSETQTCLTDTAGQCEVSKQFDPDKVEDNTTYTVIGLTHGSLVYDPGLNDVADSIAIIKD